MDITFHTSEGRFNYRVCAIFLHQNKVLAMRDERSPYYYLPGGRVALGETAQDALQRELQEELDISARIQRPLWLNQAFFTEDVDGEFTHELCLYFLMDAAGTGLLERGESFTRYEGQRRHEFIWLPLEELQDTYFYPIFLKEGLSHLPGQFTLREEME